MRFRPQSQSQTFAVSTFLAALVSVSGAGCAAQPDTAGDSEDTSVDESAVVDSNTDGCAYECKPEGCVLYARCRTENDVVPGTLPYGLTYWSDKVNAINSATAHHGCVAMIPTGSEYGHVAYVRDTWLGNDGVRRYSISEASWSYAYKCDLRNGSKSGLNIRGFWCP